jgi:hypothetical protein
MPRIIACAAGSPRNVFQKGTVPTNVSNPGSEIAKRAITAPTI